MKFLNKINFSVLALACATAGLFSTVNAASQQEALEVIIDLEKKMIPVRVSADTPEMHQLANLAFESHKAFRRVASGQRYDVKFSAAGANRMRVVVSKGAQTVLSETFSGLSQRNALLFAADQAVKKLTGRPGFFTARLTFIGERTGSPEVYISDLFLGEMQQITNDKARCLTPRWSPDGGKIIFTSYLRTGFPNIYVLDLVSRQRTIFANYKGTNSAARYSHRGDRVAMVLSPTGNPDVYVSDSSGKQLTRMTRTANAVESSPCWSPDDSKLLYVSDSQGGPQLYLMPSGGGAAQRVNTAVSRYCVEPDWSAADPNKIAFTIRQGRGFQIAVYDFSKKETQKTTTNAPLDAINPCWLPDGRHLVYTQRSANARSLWIWDSETGRSTRISAEQIGPVSEASVWPH